MKKILFPENFKRTLFHMKRRNAVEVKTIFSVAVLYKIYLKRSFRYFFKKTAKNGKCWRGGGSKLDCFQNPDLYS